MFCLPRQFLILDSMFIIYIVSAYSNFVLRAYGGPYLLKTKIKYMFNPFKFTEF